MQSPTVSTPKHALQVLADAGTGAEPIPSNANANDQMVGKGKTAKKLSIVTKVDGKEDPHVAEQLKSSYLIRQRQQAIIEARKPRTIHLIQENHRNHMCLFPLGL